MVRDGASSFCLKFINCCQLAPIGCRGTKFYFTLQAADLR